MRISSQSETRVTTNKQRLSMSGDVVETYREKRSDIRSCRIDTKVEERNGCTSHGILYSM